MLDVKVLEQLTPTTRSRVTKMHALVGNTLSEISHILGTNDAHQGQLDYTATQRKGSAGVFLEELMTGTRGDVLSEADDGIVELKSATIKPATTRSKSLFWLDVEGYQLVDAFRIFNFHFTHIQNIPFEQSSLVKKQFMLVALYTKSPTSNVGDSVFKGFGVIDLSGHHDRMKADYEATQQVCREGNAHLIGSHTATGWKLNAKTGHSKIQPGAFIKTYSSASNNVPKKYIDADGNPCVAKGRDFRLFKPEFHEMLQVI